MLNRLKARKKAAFNFATSVSGGIICLVMFVFGVMSTWDHFNRGTLMAGTYLELLTAPFLLVIPIGFSVLFIEFLRRSHRYLKLMRASPSELDEERPLEEHRLF